MKNCFRPQGENPTVFFIFYLLSFIFSHRLRRGDLEHRQDVIDHAAHRQAQGNASLLHGALGVQNAAGVVETVEARCQINDKAGDAGRVVFFCGGGNLGRIPEGHINFT